MVHDKKSSKKNKNKKTKGKMKNEMKKTSLCWLGLNMGLAYWGGSLMFLDPAL